MGFVLFPGKEGVFCEMVSSRDYPVLVSYHLDTSSFSNLELVESGLYKHV
jgi:hypothetical protein